MLPPLLTVTVPLTVPLPPKVPGELTVTAPEPVPLPVVLFTSSVPSFTVVPPE